MPHDEAEIEATIVAAGKTAPRMTSEHIDGTIAAERFWQPDGTTLTVCVLTTINGFTVVGHSAAADARNFDKAIGERIARDNARQKIWPLEGYLLRQRLHENEQVRQITARSDNAEPAYTIRKGHTNINSGE